MKVNSNPYDSKLFYIHGYQSQPNGTKGLLFREKLNAIPIKYRDVAPEELIIHDCLEQISKAIRAHSNVILIGSSLGGLLAASTSLKHQNISRMFLLNPAIIPPDTDIASINSMPKRILKDMIIPELFSKKIEADLIIFRGTKDDVVPDKWVLDFAKAQEATIHFLSDDHRFSNTLPRILEKISKHLGQIV